ncbi:MAG TPA: DUF4159 domain-containing protein [Candidatus Cybelea sp.]|nr:DUF4159 domain-containing protein [Candidatus Cybelea sp.]
MLTLGGIAFASPWLLIGLAALPVLWWLLRLTPPAPKLVPFPAIRLLFGLIPKEETPHRTPWWLILLRLAIAALLIVGLSHPLWNAAQPFSRSGPLLLVIDDGWAAGPGWGERQALAEETIAEADREHRGVALLTTAPQANGHLRPLSLLSAAQAAAQVAALQPSPWPVDRAQALTVLKAADFAKDLNTVWLADGLAGAQGALGDQDRALLDAINQRGQATLADDGPGAVPIVLTQPEIDAQGITVRAIRATAGAPQRISVRVLDRDNHSLGVVALDFAADAVTATQKVELPIELRSRVSMLALEGGQSAASVALVDDSGGRKPIGVITDNPTLDSQPLLGELYYIQRALAPSNEVRIGDLATLVQQPISMMILPDQTALSPDDRATLAKWVQGGGMLVRFAGERLSTTPDDDLLPVRLRQGDRVLGGALSWAQPTTLADFPSSSPFAGLSVPKDVHVQRQVLAEPSIDLGNKTWARLADGTPLVTGSKTGQGYLVLFHVSANAEWSDLALSGLFVEMLNRLIDLAAGTPAAEVDSTKPLPPVQTLDGFGRLGNVPAGVLPLSGADLKKAPIGPQHPPGFYGESKARRALNLSSAIKTLKPLGLGAQPLTRARTIDFKPWLLGGAFLLLIGDLLIALALRGLLVRPSLRGAAAGAAALFLAVAIGLPHPASAQPQTMSDDDIIRATASAHLAYVRTGAPEVDATSKAGLRGLTQILLQRTSADVGDPVGLDLETDDLTFYPLIYWPITVAEKQPSPEAIDRLNKYLAGGGLIFFDTADQNVAGLAGSVGPGAARLQELAQGMDIPPLVPIPADHVLTKSFYLLKDFPGRWIGGSLWVEAAKSRINDGVSSVVVGSNDYASAWAIDDYGQPLYPVTPGGERQREMAFRFGVNLVMYSMTGNYKSDQVHVPAILERLGQ